MQTLQDALFICYKQSPDNAHLVAFSQHSSSSRLIEDETFNDSGIMNNLIDYEDGQENRILREKSSFLDEETENLIDERPGSESQESNEINFNYTYPEGKSLFTILLRISRNFLTLASILEVVYTLLYFLPVYILSLLLDNEKETQEWHNYLYASTLFTTLVFSTFADSQRKYYGLMGALRIKTAVMNAIFEKRILFSDEAHFWLNGYVNKQNCRIWSEANPQVYVETPLHPEKLTVWFALWAGVVLLQKR
ncbi:hypothetical protein TNCV_2507921 [Trichonephila clavipes]|nr:hypothetical protein TNCV_2507921 [Trichonephila clavipes]